MMKFKQILFALIAVVGLSLAVSAQKGGGQDRPPKEKPPKIEPKPKDPPKPPPKKPEMSFYVALSRDDNYASDII